MFDQTLDTRLSTWLNFRKELEYSLDPLQSVLDFWRDAPFVPYNRFIDPYYQASWPSPWEIIDRNRYDDFTKALMMAYTLKLSPKFKDTDIEIHTLLDKSHIREYNLVYVNQTHVLNYLDSSPAQAHLVPDSFHLRNMVVIRAPR